MKTKKINIYKFEELKKEIQEKVLNDFKEQEDFYFLEEILKEDLNEMLKKNKIKEQGETSLFYSLSYSQGDGLSFIGCFKWKNYFIKIEQGNLSNYYSHKRTTNIYLETENGNEPNEKIQERFKEIYYKICDDLEKIGYSYIDDCLKDETIKETIEINEYTFRENGKMENI